MKIKSAFFLFAALITGPIFSQRSLTIHADTLAARIAVSQIQYQTLSARAKVTWTDGSEETTFQTNIRMRKDSIVWMSLASSGIEGARLLVDHDSVCVNNQLMGETSIHDLSFLQFWLPFPVDFTMLQQFISGQRITIGEKASMISEEDTLLVLHAESDKMRETVWVDKLNYTLRKILLKDKLLKQDMEIIFESYAALMGKPFSYKRLVTIHHGPASLQMTVDVARAKVNEELTYPFEK